MFVILSNSPFMPTPILSCNEALCFYPDCTCFLPLPPQSTPAYKSTTILIIATMISAAISTITIHSKYSPAPSVSLVPPTGLLS
jgi:hypothetical protein